MTTSDERAGAPRGLRGRIALGMICFVLGAAVRGEAHEIATAGLRFGPAFLQDQDEKVSVPPELRGMKRRKKSPKKVQAKKRREEVKKQGASPRGRLASTPVSNPFFFESPLIQTSVRAHGFYQVVPDRTSAATPGRSSGRGGYVTFLGVQGRYALSDRFALLVTKSGYVNTHFGRFEDASGGSDLAFGFKALLIESEQVAFTGGARYEAPTGSRENFMGNGDGELSPFLSLGYYLPRVNILANATWRLPFDTDEESVQFLASAHVDYELTSWWRPLAEITVQTVVEDADRTTLAEEGFDTFNLGVDGTGGNTVTTYALGSRFILSDRLTLGAAAELPMGGRKDLLQRRFLVDLELVF